MDMYYSTQKEKDKRKLYWWSLAGLWMCCGLQQFIPEARYGWIMFATYALYYCIRDTIRFHKWSKQKQKELDQLMEGNENGQD